MTQGVDKMVSQPSHRRPRKDKKASLENAALFFRCFETRSCCVAQAGLKLTGAFLFFPPMLEFQHGLVYLARKPFDRPHL